MVKGDSYQQVIHSMLWKQHRNVFFAKEHIFVTFAVEILGQSKTDAYFFKET